MPFKYAVALTGSIATGKSTAAKILKALGFEIIDADKIAHELLDLEYRTIGEMFGTEVINAKSVNRKALGAIVFSDSKKRQALEAFLHPLIYDRIEALSETLDKKQKPYLVDIPLFFEGDRYPIKHSIVVYAPKTVQLKRLMQRDASLENDAQKRIDTQIPIDEKIKKATYVIDNSGTLAQLEVECQRVKNEIIKEFT